MDKEPRQYNGNFDSLWTKESYRLFRAICDSNELEAQAIRKEDLFTKERVKTESGYTFYIPTYNPVDLMQELNRLQKYDLALWAAYTSLSAWGIVENLSIVIAEIAKISAARIDCISTSYNVTQNDEFQHDVNEFLDAVRSKNQDFFHKEKYINKSVMDWHNNTYRAMALACRVFEKDKRRIGLSSFQKLMQDPVLLIWTPENAATLKTVIGQMIDSAIHKCSELFELEKEEENETIPANQRAMRPNSSKQSIVYP